VSKFEKIDERLIPEVNIGTLGHGYFYSITTK
jgi:hypothetical protein